MTQPDDDPTPPDQRALLGGRQIRSILAARGLRPTKTRGQNFVTDPGTVRRIVRDAGVTAGDLVVEVGPGLGSLTLALREAGAHVIAVEIDAGLADALRETVDDDVEVHVADALKVDWAEITGGRSAVMVANLPYNVATPILMTGLRQGHLDGYHLMVQKEVGDRWAADVGDKAFGAVSMKIRMLATARVAGTVSRQVFHPVPKVDSVTVDVRPRPGVDPAVIEPVLTLIERGFAQRRKLLRNALAADGRRPAEIDEMLERAGLALTVRAEELTADEWVRLAAAA